jgi:hypothetical protein
MFFNINFKLKYAGESINIDDEILENVDTNKFGMKSAKHYIRYLTKNMYNTFSKDESVTVQAQLLLCLLKSRKLKEATSLLGIQKLTKDTKVMATWPLPLNPQVGRSTCSQDLLFSTGPKNSKALLFPYREISPTENLRGIPSSHSGDRTSRLRKVSGQAQVSRIPETQQQPMLTFSYRDLSYHDFTTRDVNQLALPTFEP